MELVIAVAGKPPIKNEALSLFNPKHGQTERVVSLLESARVAMAEARMSHGFGDRLLALDVEIHTPEVPPNGDATNFLGGIGDVLQDKHRRHLSLANKLETVSAFSDDRQIVRVSYRVVRSDTERYIVRLSAEQR